MQLIDVNLLIYAHRGEADRHVEYRAWLDGVLTGDSAFSVSELILAGFLRIVTHPRTFRLPTTIAVAANFAQIIRTSPNYVALAPGERHWDIFTSLCQQGNARGNLVMDAYHAALAIEHDCEWLTADRGFGRWPGLKWRHPLDG
jgi:toxin-antitoxin system PIN domain toxin